MRKVFLALGLCGALFTGFTVWSPNTQVQAEELPKPAKVAESQKESQDEWESKALAWLVENQLPNGGWGQGEEGAMMQRRSMPAPRITEVDTQKVHEPPAQAYPANVADTCMATLALLRSGSTADKGPYSENVRKGLDYILSEIEASDKDSLYITSVRGTKVQSKIGTYVDTFLASLLLSEIKDKMADTKEKERLELALHKVITKIENNQGENGTWANEGWAPVLSQSIAAKGLNRARQVGVKVDDRVLDRAQEYAQSQVDGSGKVRAEGAAGVDLYATSANVAAMQERANTNSAEERKYKDLADKAPSAKERDAAKSKLELMEAEKKANESSNQMALAKVKDPAFVSGFGSNGGEEFLSYMNISEALAVKGGKEWEDWNQAISMNLKRVQNDDGSWSGHHCITGKTFCTSSALLVLTADRAPRPVAQK